MEGVQGGTTLAGTVVEMLAPKVERHLGLLLLHCVES